MLSYLGDCSCFFENCGPQTGHPAPPHVPSCHHEGTQNREKPSDQGCCQKCRIEKTAILSFPALYFDPLRTRTTVASSGMVLSKTLKGKTPFIDANGIARHSPPGFFVGHVLGASLALRAPPEKSLPVVTI